MFKNIKKKTKYRVTFLLDKTNLWIEKQLISFNFQLNKKYIFKISKNPNKILNQDIVFPLSYTRILPEKFLNRNNLVLVAHPSKLPRDKGFAPIQNQILRNKRKIYISLIKAVNEVDSGPIVMQDYFKLKGTELNDEIRYLQGLNTLNLIKKFLKKYPKIKYSNQGGKGNFNKRRNPSDSKLNVNKTLKQQFNLLRINDNNLFPSFFYFKGKKYILKIFKGD